VDRLSKSQSADWGNCWDDIDSPLSAPGRAVNLA
jgi:hypothetical protein